MISHQEDSAVRAIIRQALEEDLGAAGDITSQALFSAADTAEAIIKSKEHGLLAGTYLLAPLCGAVDPALAVAVELGEGGRLNPGSVICRLTGSVRSVLAIERIALNFLQRLSGIATRTAHMVSLMRNSSAHLLDTRKTTPLLRVLEKRAVLAGGGCNHRFGLYDMVLIKDTHLKAAGTVTAAIHAAQRHIAAMQHIKIEVEVQSVEQFREAVAAAPDRIMLDNMSCEDMKTCVAILKSRGAAIETEASGNITEENIAAVAATGVDFVSSGSITHSVRALDIHLVIV